VRSIFRRSITIRTLLVGGVLAALLGAVFAVLVVAVREQQAAGRLALRSQQAIGAGSALETSLVNLENGVRGYVASGWTRCAPSWGRSSPASGRSPPSASAARTADRTPP
jgi:CHASE3 domain sensor protein